MEIICFYHTHAARGIQRTAVHFAFRRVCNKTLFVSQPPLLCDWLWVCRRPHGGLDMDDGEPRFLNIRLAYDIWQFLRAAVGLHTKHVLVLDSMARHLAEVGLVLYAGTIVRDRDNRTATCT